MASVAIAMAIGVARASAETIVHENYRPVEISTLTGIANLTVSGGTLD